jgi:hypothetical protein
MKRISTDVLIKKLSILTASMSTEVKEKFSDLTVEQLNWQPNDKTWSIANCLEHLNAFYRYYIPVLNGKIANTRFNEPIEHFTSSPMGRAVYRSVKLGKVHNVKRLLKSRKEYNPLVNSSLQSENVIEDYLGFQEQFVELVKASQTIDFRKTKCPLSLRPVVKLNLGDALIYMAYHNERHIYQAKSILKMLK